MRNIVFTRIDDRLIHGQVMTAWVHETKANEIVIIDNEVAQDDFLKMIMTSSAPAGIKVLIMSEEQAIDYLTQEPDRNKLIVLAKNPKVIKNITDGGVKIEALNVGGMGARKDAHNCIEIFLSVMKSGLASNNSSQTELLFTFK